MTNTATRINLPTSAQGGTAHLYRCDPPMPYTRWDYDRDVEIDASIEYVVVSDIDNEFGVETYIFAANAQGEITNWGELPGSFRGGRDHARALAAVEIVIP